MDEKAMRAVARNVLQFDNIQNFLVRQEFWCAECDHSTVDSGLPDSGKFFQVSGHVRKIGQKDDTGDYENIIFAICANCLAKG